MKMKQSGVSTELNRNLMGSKVAKKTAFVLLGALLSGIALADICPKSNELTFDPADSKLKYVDTQRGITWISDIKVNADTVETLDPQYQVDIIDTRLDCSYVGDWATYINLRPYSSEDIKRNPLSDAADKGYTAGSSAAWRSGIIKGQTIARCDTLSKDACEFNSPVNLIAQ